MPLLDLRFSELFNEVSFDGPAESLHHVNSSVSIQTYLPYLGLDILLFLPLLLRAGATGGAESIGAPGSGSAIRERLLLREVEDFADAVADTGVVSAVDTLRFREDVGRGALGVGTWSVEGCTDGFPDEVAAALAADRVTLDDMMCEQISFAKYCLILLRDWKRHDRSKKKIEGKEMKGREKECVGWGTAMFSEAAPSLDCLSDAAVNAGQTSQGRQNLE